MTDRAYIVIRTLEDIIAIAENNDQNALFVTIDALKNILALLKEQEKRINELEEKLRLLEYGDQDILQSGLKPAT